MRFHAVPYRRLILGIVLYILLYFINISYFIWSKFIKKNVKNKRTEVAFRTNIAKQIQPFANFTYPLEVDLEELVKTYKQHGVVRERVINPYPYTYLVTPKQKCKVKKQAGRTDTVFVLFLVKSSYMHVEQRDAIRRTWGNESYMTYFNIRTVFILGLPQDGADSRVNVELRKYGDIIQRDFKDTYMNNTLKMMSAIYWTVEYCMNAQFVVMVDDDYYVSMETLVNLLLNLPLELRQQLYLGNIVNILEPNRKRGDKWYVSAAEYSFDKYPPFINAGTIVMSMDFVKDVRIAMPYTALFRLDDIYMSILAYKLGVTPIGSNRFCNFKIGPDRRKPFFNYIVTSHGYSPEEQLRAWDLHKKRPNMRPSLQI